MDKINIQIKAEQNKNYNIYIDENLQDTIATELNNLPSKKAVLVTNETIFELYGEILPQIFEKSKLQLEYCIIQDGEQYKNKTSLDKILTCAFEAKLERNDLFIAFGGGVIGDMTGFAAAIYLRGINFVQIPTTILAQVDSSVGGKVAINNAYGKNLIGAFYQPNAVFSNLCFLKTLPPREILTGLSEVLKYSFIEKTCNRQYNDFARFLFENAKQILHLDFEYMKKVIKTSCELKAAVVEQDEKEAGLRAILNFGHTIGHGIEKTTHYKVFTHGEAVSVGMKAAFMISHKLEKISADYFDFAMKLLNSYGFNFKIPADILPDTIANALSYDKKVKNGHVRFVLPIDYAEVEIFDNIDKEVILSVIRELY